MEKKSKLPLILLVAVIAMAIYGGIRYYTTGNLRTPDEPVTSATHGEGMTRGELDGNTYTLTAIGMKLTLPESFEVISGKALDTQIKGGASAFFRFAARNNERQEVLTLAVPTTEKGANAYLTEAQETLEKQRTKIGEIEDMEISGFRFQTLRNEADDQNGQKLVEISLAYEQGGKLFVLNDLFPAEEEEAVMQSLGEMITKVEPTTK